MTTAFVAVSFVIVIQMIIELVVPIIGGSAKSFVEVIMLSGESIPLGLLRGITLTIIVILT